MVLRAIQKIILEEWHTYTYFFFCGLGFLKLWTFWMLIGFGIFLGGVGIKSDVPPLSLLE